MIINPAETVMKNDNMKKPNSECIDLTGAVHTNTNRNWLSRPAIAITSAAICMCLSSCMIPADDYGRRSTTYTSYQPGYRVQTLPSGYRSEIISGQTYYYNGGNYYRRSGDGYLITDAPRSSRYYSDYGRIRQQPDSRYDSRDYGRRDQRHDHYDDVIIRLPDGYRVVNHRGREYYQVGDRYYIRQNDRYTMVARPY